jgi:hypothetical protein
MLETLYCNAEHSFSREKVRGRKPVWCPEHRPVTVNAQFPVPVVEVEDEPTVLKPVRVPTIDHDVSKSIYEDENVDDEIKSKLRYAERQIQNTAREQADINLMTDVRRRLIIEAERQMTQSRVLSSVA